jgi:hypothetical protein
MQAIGKPPGEGTGPTGKVSQSLVPRLNASGLFPPMGRGRKVPQIRFALSRGFAVSGWIFDGVTRGGRAPGVALDPWLISYAHSGHSVSGSADRLELRHVP